MTPRKKFDITCLPERPDLYFESELWAKGLRFVAGVDEAGRGALAGPVAAAAVVLPCDVSDLSSKLDGVNDSKLMTPEDRDEKAAVIKELAIIWGVGFASSKEIDSIGILPATYRAAERALAKIEISLEHILLDYILLPGIDVPQTPLIKGDARSLSIAAASILAKTARDALMVKMNGVFSGYHFDTNKGYGTEAHRQAIERLGPCEEHRKTFSPLKEYFSLFPPNS